MLSTFFQNYTHYKLPTAREHRELLLDCFIPTLRAVAYAPKASPLSGINPTMLSSWFLDLLQTNSNPNAKQDNQVYYIISNFLKIFFLLMYIIG